LLFWCESLSSFCKHWKTLNSPQCQIIDKHRFVTNCSKAKNWVPELIQYSAHEISEIALQLTMQKCFNRHVNCFHGLNERKPITLSFLEFNCWTQIGFGFEVTSDAPIYDLIWFDLMSQNEMWHRKQNVHQTQHNCGDFHNVHLVHIIDARTRHTNEQNTKLIDSTNVKSFNANRTWIRQYVWC
jgi:hypothetical protein